MKPIPKKRKIREIQKHISFFTNDTPSKIHIMNIDFIVDSVKLGLKITGLDKRAYENAKHVKVRELTFRFSDLPQRFDGYRILFMSDLHIDGMNPLCDILVSLVEELSYDICVLGGDYRFLTRGNIDEAISKLDQLTATLLPKSEVLAVLGNHDEYEIGEKLEAFGVKMLINDSHKQKINEDEIYFCGLDDCHYYAAHDFAEAEKNVPKDAFKILISHSPELYSEASEKGYQLYLAGHTHGGQLCLPFGIPVICEAHVPHRMIGDKWMYENLTGYTSFGAGTSGTPGRFNSSSEIVVLEMRCA